MSPTWTISRRGPVTVQARMDRRRSPRVQRRHHITQICPFCGHGKKRRRGSRRSRRSRKRRPRRRKSFARRVSVRRMIGARRPGSRRSRRGRSGRRSIRKTSARRVVGRESKRGRRKVTRNTSKKTPENPNPQQPTKPPKKNDNCKDTRLEIPNAFQTQMEVDLPQHSSWAHPRTDYMHLQNPISHSLWRPGTTQTNRVAQAAKTLKPSNSRLCHICQLTEGAALEEGQPDTDKKGSADEDHQSDSSRSSARHWNAKIPQDGEEK